MNIIQYLKKKFHQHDFEQYPTKRYAIKKYVIEIGVYKCRCGAVDGITYAVKSKLFKRRKKCYIDLGKDHECNKCKQQKCTCKERQNGTWENNLPIQCD